MRQIFAFTFETEVCEHCHKNQTVWTELNYYESTCTFLAVGTEADFYYPWLFSPHADLGKCDLLHHTKHYGKFTLSQIQNS